MPTPTLDTRPDGALVIEADTAAEALTEIGARLGEDAEILSATKVHRGGWHGFFAREVVQLTARPREDRLAVPPPPTADDRAAASEDEAPHGLSAALAELARTEEAHESAFRDVLVRQLTGATDETAPDRSEPTIPPPPAESPAPWLTGSAEVPAVSPAPTAANADAATRATATDPATPTTAAPSVQGRVPDVSTAAPTTEPADGGYPTRPSAAPAGQTPSAPSGPRTTGPGVGWDLDRLRELRLPDAIIEACEGLDPDDDGAWVLAIAAAVSSWCRPLPARDAVLVGPRAHRIAEKLGLPSAEPGQLVPNTGSVGLRASDTPAGRAWVEDVRAGRWGHLVVGGTRWQAFLFDDVTAVSWVGEESLPAALEVAGRMGLVLGYGLGAVTGKRPVRATPVDVALTIRSLLPRTQA